MYTTVICNFSLFALQGPPPAAMMMTETQGAPQVTQGEMSSAEFYSTEYPSVYRETVVHKDERGHYIDPFRGLASKGYGRRLMYDQSHPQVRLSDGQEFEQVIGTRGPRQDSSPSPHQRTHKARKSTDRFCFKAENLFYLSLLDPRVQRYPQIPSAFQDFWQIL